MGRKVSLRYALHDDPNHPVSEAIGHVQSVDDQEGERVSITIVNRRGETKVIPIDDIQAAKLFPN